MSFMIFQLISNSVIKATDLTVTLPYTGAKLKRKVLLIIMILLFNSLVKGKGWDVQCLQSWYSIFSISPFPALIHTLIKYFNVY